MTWNRYTHALWRAVPSCLGFARFWVRHPVFAFKLLYARAFYFAMRRLPCPVRDPYGFVILTDMALISYWDFVIERNMRRVRSTWWADLSAMQHPVCIDVGANAGVFSYLLTRCNPTVEIYAFEPQEEPRNSLLQIHQHAHGGFHVSFFGVGDGILPKLDASIPTTVQIALLKIDTDGGDYNVLLGASETLKRTRRIIIEVTDPVELMKVRSLLVREWTCQRISCIDYLFVRRQP